MLSLTGMLVNVFKAPDGKTRDGESYEGAYQGQILAVEGLRNGQERQTLVDLRTDDPKAFEGLTGAQVAVAVRAYPRKNGVGFAHLDGSAVNVLDGEGETSKNGSGKGAKQAST